MTESEKLQQQLNQYNNIRPDHQQQHYTQRHPSGIAQQPPRGMPQQAPYIPVPPPSFGIPPPNMAGSRMMPPHDHRGPPHRPQMR